MAPTFPRERPVSASRSEMRDPFAAQLRLSRVHSRLVPMQASGVGYVIDPAVTGWFELPASRGFAGYGLGRALGLLLDVMQGLSALNETTTESGEPFAHGEFTPLQFRVDPLGVCRLIPLTTRHYVSEYTAPPRASLGFLSPERLIAEKVGLRADVFSAGVLLWEALAGRRLIDGDRPEVIVERLMSRKIRVPSLPPQLDWAAPLKAEVERALSINQQRRFADCAEFSEVILRIAQDRVASHDEIAAFFGSNFATTPSVPPVSEPSSALSPVSVSREVPIANRGATFRMLPATSVAPAAPMTEASDVGPRRGTLKMNVTLRMAHVPVPTMDEEPPSAAPAPAPASTPASQLQSQSQSQQPLPTASAAPQSPPLFPSTRFSPLPMRRSSPPPLPPPLPSSSPVRRSSPPPLPSLRGLRQSAPPISLPELTIPAPPLLEFEPLEPVLPAPAPPRSAPAPTPEFASPTPVPTQLSLLDPPGTMSLPPTTSEPAVEDEPLPRKRRLATFALAAALIIGTFAAIRMVTDHGARGSTIPTRAAARSGGSVSIGSATTLPAPATLKAPPAAAVEGTYESAAPERANNPDLHPPELAPSADRSATPPGHQSPNRPALNSGLPAGKDYGI